MYKLITNNNDNIFLKELKTQLKNCDQFIFVVAFITESGVQAITKELKELESRDIKGTVITGTYLNFTQPQALDKLAQFKNIDLHIYDGQLHIKSYMFKNDSKWNVFVGSSNLTINALTTNQEWNSKSVIDTFVAEDILTEINSLKSNSKPYVEIIDSYRRDYLNEFKNKKAYQKFLKQQTSLTPYPYQQKILNEITKSYNQNIDKGLLLSATGTGKTVMAAFAAKEANPEKLLFVIHRENIAKKAMETFKQVFPNKEMSLYTGNQKDKDGDFIFTTIQTISKDKNLNEFKPDYFDYIIIDEVHHAGALSYTKIINYFKPKFLLGLTATPERTDGINIYEMFDYNIIYNLSLKQSLEENLLTPFYYYGIADIEFEEQVKKEEEIEFLNLNDEQRIKHIIRKAKEYGYSGDKLHGLIFVSNIEQALNLESQLATFNIKAKALTGFNKEEERAKAIKEFEEGKYEYLITVDIFNEGIDIPVVNQIILLRKTQSIAVYLQQLGRGLRLSDNKEYVTVLDFIANYETNFMLPLALTQKVNYDKDEMLTFISQDINVLYGNTIVEFEEIVQEKLLNQISKFKYTKQKNLINEYISLRNKLNRKLYLTDFYNENNLSPLVILDFRKIGTEKVTGSYQILNALERQHQMLTKDKSTNNILSEKELINTFEDNTESMSKDIDNNIQFISNFLTPSKSPWDMLIIKFLKEENGLTKEELEAKIFNYLTEENITFDKEKEIKAIEFTLLELQRLKFATFSELSKYNPIVECNNGQYKVINDLNNKYVDDLINFNLDYWQNNYCEDKQLVDIQLHRLYTKVEAFKYLNCDYNNSNQVSGYTLFDNDKIGLMFINFDQESSFGNFNNIISEKRYITFDAKAGRKISKKINGKEILKPEGKVANNFYKLHIFGRKNQSKEYYYLGEVEEVVSYQEKIVNNKNVIEYKLKLKDKISQTLINYYQK